MQSIACQLLVELTNIKDIKERIRLMNNNKQVQGGKSTPSRE